MKKALTGIVWVLTLSLLTGCPPVPGTPSAIDGKWKADNLLGVFGDGLSGLPIPISPSATLVIKNGDFQIKLKTGIPIIGWFVSARVSGSVGFENKGVLNIAAFAPESVKLRVFFLSFPMSGVTLGAVKFLYRVDGTTLKLIPFPEDQYNNLPDDVRSRLESGDIALPWDGGSGPGEVAFELPVITLEKA